MTARTGEIRDGINPQSVECPSCGCRHLEVVYTRPRGDGRIVRRRECRHCGRRITTTEAVSNLET
jgi:transcriptional regulator NrdR family protein